MMKISNRAQRIMVAEIRAMSIESDRVNGINLAQGVCDTPVPMVIAESARRAIVEGENSYTRFDGTPVLREAIAAKLAAFNGLNADPETEITVSAGSTGSFFCACFALLEPGDGVILLEPYYGYHLNTLRALDLVPKFVPLRLPDWSFSDDDLRAAVGPSTRAIVVNTPANPCGKVFDLAELKRIEHLAKEHDLVVLTDEIYEHFVYDGHRHISPATLPGLKERTVTISGVSKTFSITGWRIGYSYCRADWAEVIGAINDLVYVCAPAPLQAGVASGLDELDADYYRAMADEFVGRRDHFCSALDEAGLSPHVPEGAYYVLADVSSIPGSNAHERAIHLLDTTGLASVPGSAFYSSGEGETMVRFCFAKPNKQIAEACRRLSRFRA